jgi:hypothetical protein
MEWHDVVVVAGDLPQTVRQLIAEQKELAYEEGLRGAVEEIHNRPIGDATISLELVRRSKLRQMPPPNGAA